MIIQNWYLVFFAIFCNLTETSYFGWNISPKSDAEMIADLLCAIIFAMSMIKTGSD
jgi:hypothetical protein